MHRVSFRDSAFRCSVAAASALIVAVFAWLLADMLWHGLPRLSWTFLTSEPRSSGRSGGIAPILVSTALLLTIAIGVALLLGLATAAFLVEFTRAGGRPARLIGLSLDVLAGVPSIVFGLFGNALFSVWLGLGFSILSGGLTLACMTLPILIRTAESGLRSVPADWRLAAAALGLTRATTLTRILLPAASPAIVAGLILGIGRAAAETAALVFTSGYVDRMPESLFDSGRSIAVHIYDLTMNVAGGEASAYASALVLVGLLVAINSIAIFLTDRLWRRRIVINDA